MNLNSKEEWFMNKLLRVELSRRLTSIIYIGEIILLLVYNFLEISGSTYGFEVNIPYFLFNKTTLICIFISINVVSDFMSCHQIAHIS